MANQSRVMQVERFDDRSQVVRVAIHVVSGRCLPGATVAASIMGDDAKAQLRQEMHLPVPRVSIQGPPMGERDDRASAPILEIDLGAVFTGNRIHSRSSSQLMSRSRIATAYSFSGRKCGYPDTRDNGGARHEHIPP